MVQYAAGLDHVEGPADRAQLQNVGLRIMEIAQSKRARLSLRIAEAGQAEIDREDVGANEPLCGLDRVLTGTAAGDQDFEAVDLAEGAKARERQLAPQIHVDRRGLEQ